MANTLYVANFPPATTEAQLRELFGQYGEVVSVEFGTDTRSQVPYALVTMAVERNATQAYNSLNGYLLEGRYLAVSYPEVEVKRTLMTKQRKALEAIIAQLGESEKIPLCRLEAMARLCGIGFMQALVTETEEVEAQGGLMTADGSRRRTKGGVFFILARDRMAAPVRHIIYNRKGKMPEAEPAAEAAQAEQTGQQEPAP